MTRVAIFGDIGGHARPFADQLVALGADPSTLRLPADLSVVVAGDLIHRGPDSPGVLRIVADLLDHQGEQVVALSGNHEAQYFAEPRFGWPERLPDASQDLLRSWWADGRIRVAAGVRTGVGEELLVTHAGLTSVIWSRLGSPADVTDAADAVNALIPDAADLWRAGVMLGDTAPILAAGPWWADAACELVPSWVLACEDGTGMPFSQVHGHSSVFWFDRGEYNRNLPRMLRPVTTVDLTWRHTTVRLPGGRIVGVDPCHGKDPAPTWAPLVLHDAAVVAR